MKAKVIQSGERRPTGPGARTLPLLAALLTLAGPAAAEFTYSYASGVDVTFYGQLNPSFLSFDDGVDSTGRLTDSTHSNSRVGIRVAKPYGWGALGFNFETGLGLPGSARFSQTGSPDLTRDRTVLRKVDLEFRTERFGTFYVGQGSMATDGVATQDLSRTGLVLGNSVGDTAGTFEYRTAAGALSGITIDSSMRNLDGGRRGRLRYDTPPINGFTFSVAAGEDVLSYSNNDEFFDIAIRYGTEFDGTLIRGAIGYNRRDRSGASDLRDTFGSLAVLFPSGVNLHLSFGDRDDGGDYVYGKLGYIGDWWSVGDTAIAVDYYDGSDFPAAVAESESYGVGVVQHFDDKSVQAYAAYRRYEYSDPGASYLRASSVFVGARWQF